MSGGLDSTLAAKMLINQGVDVTGVYVSTGFCISAQQKRNGKFDEAKPDVFKVAEELDIPLEVIDISQEYIGIVTNPKYGWGKNVNPCIDCRIYMLQKTKELMEKNGFDFIATGEVVGQRPKSQRKHTALLIEEKSGLQGDLLRPLSAKFHQKTKPEIEGWIDRESLGAMQGRSRKPQLALAKTYGIKNIQAPAGGCCYLTDENYSVRFKDLLSDRKTMLQDTANPPLTHNDMIILSIGRQIKLRRGLKVIAGRNETENKLLRHYRQQRIIIEPVDAPGPTALLDIIEPQKIDQNQVTSEGDAIWDLNSNNIGDDSFPETDSSEGITQQEIALAASITARYGDAKNEDLVTMKICPPDGTEYDIRVKPFSNEPLLHDRLIMKANENKISTPALASTKI